MSTIIKQRQRRTTARNRRRESPRSAPSETTGAPEQRAASSGAQARHADAQITSSAAELASRSDRRRWIALAVLCLGQLMMVLDATIVNVALPSIQHDLRSRRATSRG